METRFHLFVCVFQVILAYESIVLCKCSGKYIDIYFSLKITYHKRTKRLVLYIYCLIAKM